MIAPWDVGIWVVNTIEDALKNIQTILEGFKTVATTGGVPIVRHIQAGVVSSESGGSATATLSGFTNAQKMIVLINGGDIYESGGDIQLLAPTLNWVNTGGVSMYCGLNRAGIRMGYQVIEFY